MKARLDYYYAFIYPYLCYNVIIWGAACDTHLSPLIVQHKRSIRTLTDSTYRAHTNPLFKQHGLLKFVDIYKYHLLIYMHKAVSKGEYAARHNIATRNRHLAVPVNRNLTSSRRGVSFRGPEEWNKLPLNIRGIERLPPFKKAVKKFLLGQYDE